VSCGESILSRKGEGAIASERKRRVRVSENSRIKAFRGGCDKNQVQDQGSGAGRASRRERSAQPVMSGDLT
jgi:hypothetical protein